MSEKCVDCYRRGFKEGVEAALEQASRGELSQEWAQRGLHPRAMAEGGLVTRPTLALLGEAGPELVIPIKKKRKVSKYQREFGRQMKKLKAAHPRTKVTQLMARGHTATRKALGMKRRSK